MVADIFGMDFVWVLVVVVVLFGGSQLPKLAKNAGDAMKEFRKAHDEATGSAQSPGDQAYAPQPPASSQVPAPPAIAPAPAPVVPGTPPSTPAGGTTASVQVASVQVAGEQVAGEQVTLSRAELDALLVAARQGPTQGTTETPEQPEA